MSKTFIIPIIFVNEKGEVTADIGGVTEEEFIEWYKNETMPKAYISVVFMKEYFKKHGYSYEFETAKIGREEVLYPKHLSEYKVKPILHELGVNIEDFTKEYSEYLRLILQY